MTCPDCGGKIQVIDIAQTNENETYRRKRCKNCSRLVFTVEYEVEPNEQYRESWQKARPGTKTKRPKKEN